VTEPENYYQILGVDPEASEAEIKKAYREKAFILHPDRLAGAPESVRHRAEEELKKLNQAYEVLRDPQKRRDYDSEWLQRSDEVKPKPVVEPQRIEFHDVEPGKIETFSFTIRNVGGAYSKIWISNPDSWVRVVRYSSLTDSDELPLQVEIEAEGKEWGKRYTESIEVKLDEEKARVSIELQTKTEPIKDEVTASSIPEARPSSVPPISSRSGLPAWGRWIIGFVVVVLAGILIVRFWPSSSETTSPPDVQPLPTITLPKTIAFISDRDGNMEIYAMALDGTNQANLSNNPADDWSPTWAPDGQEICFVSNRNGGTPGIYLMAADGSNVRQLAVDGEDPCWFPDGKKIAFTRRTGEYYALFVMNSDGTSQEQIPIDPSTIIRSWGSTYGRHLRRPDISPDGARLAFTTVSSSAYAHHIYVANLDGTDLKQFSDASGGDNPSWSPDGQTIAFRLDPGHSSKPYGRVGYPYIRNLDDSKDYTRLAYTIECGGGLDWSPDGSMVVLSATRDFFYQPMQIYIVEIDSGTFTPITEGNANNWDPDWRRQSSNEIAH
jgi:Tol biopolymer transport system component/curved DNA-binding protein CbpA